MGHTTFTVTVTFSVEDGPNPSQYAANAMRDVVECHAEDWGSSYADGPGWFYDDGINQISWVHVEVDHGYPHREPNWNAIRAAESACEGLPFNA